MKTKMNAHTNMLSSITLAARRCLSLASVLMLALVLAGCATVVPNTLSTHDSSRWAKEIAGMTASDVTNLPPQGGIVFVGSSSVRLWKTLSADFPGYPVINRGFGGSQIADSVHYADRIIKPYHPRQVVIYAGGNDIAAGKDPKLVFGDFVALAERIHKDNPRAKISFMSVGPSPSRWSQVVRVRELNRLAAEYCRKHHLDFINVFPLMLGPDGLPKPDIFVADRLHMNPKGYAIWREAVGPHLVR